MFSLYRVGCFMLCVLGIAAGAWAQPFVLYSPDGGGIINPHAEKSLPACSPNDQVVENGLTFNIYYDDICANNNFGFANASIGPNAQARMRDVLTYLADTVNQPGTLDIFVDRSLNSGASFLAHAATYFSQAQGFHDGTSLLRLKNGVKPYAGYEEIYVQVDFAWNWNLTTAAPTSGQVDLASVLLHELTHGLGFCSMANADGTSGANSSTDVHSYTTYDEFIARRADQFALFGGTPPHLLGAVADLTSNNVAFTGATALQRYAVGIMPGLYAPNPFADGSSLSHWDTGNIVGGAVMEHAIYIGTMRRTYAPVDLGALKDIGWANIETGSEGEGESEGGGEGEGEGENNSVCALSGCPDFDGEGTNLYASNLLGIGLNWQSTDKDGSGIPDSWEVAMLAEAMCSHSYFMSGHAICVYSANLALLRTEPAYVSKDLDGYEHVIAAMLTISPGLQGVLGPLGLTKAYPVFTYGPEYAKLFTANADADYDHLSNLIEYQNTLAANLQRADYVFAALNPSLNGSQPKTAIPVIGILGMPILVGLLALGGAIGVRRRVRR